jgi:cytidine deaminase
MKFFKELKEKAIEAKEFAYVPYSKYRVGAAILTQDGKIYTGANIENASYPMTICAECTAIVRSKMHKAGNILELVCVDGEGKVILPCGKCRQTIYEFSDGGKTKIAISDGDSREIDELLAFPFGPNDLEN